MYFSGESLNLLTLLGLMICVGLLVDNSVVVAENIHRLHRDGLDRREACIQRRGRGRPGDHDVHADDDRRLPARRAGRRARAVLPAAAGHAGLRVGGRLAARGAGLHSALRLPDAADERRPRRTAVSSAASTTGSTRILRAVYDATFGRLNRSYNRLLASSLQHRFDLVVVVLARLRRDRRGADEGRRSSSSMQEDERGGFYIDVEMPQSTTLEETEAWFLEVEKVVEAKKEELGLDGWFLFHRKTFGELQGWFDATARPVDVTAAEATEVVLDALPKKPGIKLTTGDDRETSDMTRRVACSRCSCTARTPEQLRRDRRRAGRSAGPGADGVLGSRGSSEQAPNELALVVDRERAQQLRRQPAGRRRRGGLRAARHAAAEVPPGRQGDPGARALPGRGPREPDRAGRFPRAHRRAATSCRCRR